MMQTMIRPQTTVLRIWLDCTGCKTVLKTLIDETDNGKTWAISIASPQMRHAVCPYCESRKRVRLHVELITKED
jgi:sarcosine oxidase delta subunit